MAAAPVPGIGPASVLYEAGFSRSLIIERLQDVAIMMAMGEQLGENDKWIAATARAWGFRLISRDRAFERVPRLHVLRY